VVTADALHALHAQRAHADYVVLERGARYLLTVKGNQPRVMAFLHNLTVSVLRLASVTNIAQGLRHHAWDPLRPVTLLLTC
jgi:hypothetical protein